MTTGPTETVRERMLHVLREGPATARDLSRLIGIRERDVADHLSHLERSLKHGSERLVVRPPECLACGFTFTRRTRYTRPGQCPRCKSTRTTLPEFSVE